MHRSRNLMHRVRVSTGDLVVYDLKVFTISYICRDMTS